MQFSPEIQEYIQRSVLCWLGTSSTDNIPNVSPKEVFDQYGADKIIIANVASPGSVKNIKQNPNVCISFIDILVQKGFQIKGKARVVDLTDDDYPEMEKVLLEITEGKFPFSAIIEITMEQAKWILAPSICYILGPQKRSR